MKPLIIIIATTLIIVVSGWLSLSALDSESQRLDHQLTDLKSEIENQNWTAAENKLEEFHSKWDKTSKLWSMLVDHYEIDNIELVLSQLASFVKTKDKSEALSQLSSLRTFVKHIPEKEAFRLKNIF